MKFIIPIALLTLSGCGLFGDGNPNWYPSPTPDFLISDSTTNAYSHAFPGMEIDDQRQFFKGRALFRDVWSQAPSSTVTRDGLGPIFNAKSCVACHARDGRGRPPIEKDEKIVSILFRVSRFDPNTETWTNDPVYGDQLQPYGIQNVDGEGDVGISYNDVRVEFPDGQVVTLQKPSYNYDQLNYGKPHSETYFSPRVAPAMVGLGLLESVSESEILKWEDPDDNNKDHISGRAQKVLDIQSGKVVLGRFGWKAGQPTVLQQSAAAFAGDIGITSSLFPSENCTAPQKQCLEAPNGGSPELHESILESVAFYAKTLAVPLPKNLEDKNFIRGASIFKKIQCASCHRPQLKTGKQTEIPALSERTFTPYTDLLLHDMGEGLADHRPEAVANGREWRTAPLWGLGHIQQVNEHTRLLHDGRARNIEEAILWHGGEAEFSKSRYIQLSKEQRQSLLFFLGSL
ncbi:MAG: thiol oxidoreductase [Bdellovibrionaceae bacterium]|nr:thiol oxidoreductase [Pseudobdellovibrionaceae bacterium]|tara:strand:+ start:111000 stop:112373 length:1374 start_codon:yes stop_codon:yes gene_type:complete